MRVRLPNFRAWLLFVAFLHSVACFRSVDGTKVKCTTSDHCPDNYSCSAGKCVSRSSATPDGGGYGMDGGSSAGDGRSSGLDSTEPRTDATSPDFGVDVSAATSEASTPDLPSEIDTKDAPLSGTGDAGGAGVDGTDGTGGILGLGGNGGSTGGARGSGGVVGSGGTVANGGVVGSGGITGAGGATCQPKSRDCTSSLDNDCNGTPDNQETTYCTCLVGKSQPCQQHPGYDGAGICKAGSQACSASSDKTTSSWGTCSESVGPGTRNCTSSVANDCNGTPANQETVYCQCPAGTSQSCLPAGMCKSGSQTCAASSDTTTTGWGPCTGYTGPSTMYRDSDGDGYGNPAQSGQVCLGTAGYVNNGEDCDDGNSAFYPGVSDCASDHVTRKWCVAGGGGVTKTELCSYGCMNGSCRPASDGMIGVPGYVSCTNSPKCSTADGCRMDDQSGGCGTAGAGSSVFIYCDGPNDCPGQKCLFYTTQGYNESSCYATQQPDGSSYVEVCDPLASTCTPPLACVKDGRYTLYLCQ